MTARHLRRAGLLGAATAALVGASVTAAAVSIASGSDPPSTDSPIVGVFPGDDWELATPEAVGLDPTVLDEVAVGAGAADSNCLVVVRHGLLVGEWYWNETTAESAQEVFSVSKSVTSALVGIAQANGDLDITEPASGFIPEWHGTESETVTIENLLSNDSGREWSAEQDYIQMAGEVSDQSAFAVGLGQMADPNTLWVYNNAAIQTLSEVLQASTGEEPAEYAETVLFGAIGMADTDMTTDAAGNTKTYMGVQSTCRDLARFGLLYLNQGNWDGTEVIPRDFVEASVGRPSQDLNASYGYLWWLNRPGSIMVSPVEPIVEGSPDNTVDGQMVDGAPDDMFWASGLAGQWIQIDPGTETVAVRLGPFGGDFSLDILSRVATDAALD
jgi:CubicO group peptidase (beta-lactamase class C family)